jgi:hypothetical protein
LKNLRKENIEENSLVSLSVLGSLTGQRCQPEGVENIHEWCEAAAESLYLYHGFSVESWVHMFLTMPVADKGEVLR